MDDRIVISAYDPDWPRQFLAERDRLISHLAEAVHIGSTAVPGLDAKPVIDVMGGVVALADADAAIPHIEALGYEYISEHESTMPYRRFFRLQRDGVRIAHLHVVEMTHTFWRDHLAFRDWLRDHDQDSRAYAALKHDLATRFADDRSAYTRAKSEFIAELMVKALDRL